ncbi:hypothetical protein RI367_007669 [Sorochytrium milnesiophthora]
MLICIDNSKYQLSNNHSPSHLQQQAGLFEALGVVSTASTDRKHNQHGYATPALSPPHTTASADKPRNTKAKVASVPALTSEQNLQSWSNDDTTAAPARRRSHAAKSVAFSLARNTFRCLPSSSGKAWKKLEVDFARLDLTSPAARAYGAYYLHSTKGKTAVTFLSDAGALSTTNSTRRRRKTSNTNSCSSGFSGKDSAISLDSSADADVAHGADADALLRQQALARAPGPSVLKPSTHDIKLYVNHEAIRRADDETERMSVSEMERAASADRHWFKSWFVQCETRRLHTPDAAATKHPLVSNLKQNAHKMLKKMAMSNSSRNRHGHGKLLIVKGTYVTMNGVQYVRTQNGKLLKHEPHTMKVIQNRHVTLSVCRFGTHCLNIHDPQRVIMCRYFLRGKCQDPMCTRSHTPSPYRSPLCSHFEAGNCTRTACPFLHVKLPASAPTCLDFLRDGFCPNGAACTSRHALECPEWTEYGLCPNAKCPHLHVRRRPSSAGSSRSLNPGQKREDAAPLVVSPSDQHRPNFTRRDDDYIPLDDSDGDDGDSVGGEGDTLNSTGEDACQGDRAAEASVALGSSYIEIDGSDSEDDQDEDDLLRIFDGSDIVSFSPDLVSSPRQPQKRPRDDDVVETAVDSKRSRQEHAPSPFRPRFGLQSPSSSPHGPPVVACPISSEDGDGFILLEDDDDDDEDDDKDDGDE